MPCKLASLLYLFCFFLPHMHSQELRATAELHFSLFHLYCYTEVTFYPLEHFNTVICTLTGSRQNIIQCNYVNSWLPLLDIGMPFFFHSTKGEKQNRLYAYWIWREECLLHFKRRNRYISFIWVHPTIWTSMKILHQHLMKKGWEYVFFICV